MRDINARGRLSGKKGAAGSINWLTIVLILAVVAGIYFAYKFLPPYVTDYSFHSFLEVQGRNAFEWDDDRLRNNIIEYCRVNDIPLEEENWSVHRNDDDVFIRVKYGVVVTLPFGMDRIIPFEHEIKQEIQPLREL